MGRGEGISAIAAPDPRQRRDFKVAETQDKMRTVWTRHEKAPEGYELEVRLLSASRKQLGDRLEEFVEFKYVSVAREDLEKFDHTMQTRQRQ